MQHLNLSTMATKSKHPADINKWIEGVIESCETTRQLETARNLVYLFDKNLNKDYSLLFFRDLMKRLDDKFFSLVEEKLQKGQSGENFSNIG